MTAKNSILLIIKQSPGIDYNSLLSKIASNYGSVNSARAALSRAVKDMTAVGLITKDGRKFVATEKGQAMISGEMKNKLLLKLNQTLQSKNSAQDIDTIVEQLAVLIERSKADPDLLKAARGNSRFYISDLKQIAERLDKRISQMQYYKEIFGKQIDSLCQLDFNDSFSTKWKTELIPIIISFANQLEATELLVESPAPGHVEELALALNEKTKSQALLLPKQRLSELLKLAEQQFQNPNYCLSIFLANTSIQLSNNQLTIIGPHQKIIEIQAQLLPK